MSTATFDLLKQMAEGRIRNLEAAERAQDGWNNALVQMIRYQEALGRIALLDKTPYLSMPHGDAGYIHDLQKIAREALEKANAG